MEATAQRATLDVPDVQPSYREEHMELPHVLKMAMQDLFVCK